jgi:uncharacterized protein (TIGR02453 family)
MANLKQSNFDFLVNLEKNNNREWFLEQKELYTKERENIISFADNLLKEMNKHDHIENESGKKMIFRIYRDVRFSKNKLPYKTHWGLSLKRATKSLRGSYFVHLKSGECYIGCGFWGPVPEDLKRIRTQFTMFGDEFNEIINDKTFVKNFGKLEGEKLKNGPKGFDKEDAQIELLKYKQFLISKAFTDKEVLSPDFAKNISDTFKKMRPFLDFMSETLTTDVNGEPLF